MQHWKETTANSYFWCQIGRRPSSALSRRPHSMHSDCWSSKLGCGHGWSNLCIKVVRGQGAWLGFKHASASRWNSPRLSSFSISICYCDVNPPTKPFLATRDILYADDTLLAAIDAATVQCNRECVAETGKGYGLQLHSGKTILLQLQHDGVAQAPDGTPLQAHEQTVYLQALLATTGDPKQELIRRACCP